MTSKQFNLDDYDKDTINQFDTVGTYFVKVFYNTLHDRAKDEMFSGSKHKSTTDAYRGWITQYVNMLSKSATFDEISAQIFSYYCEDSRTHTNRTDFIMGFTKLFVPIDYHENLNMMGYITLYKQIIRDVVKLFAKEIIDNHIKQIIDDHHNKTNVRSLQEKIISLFCYYKDSLIQKFVRKAITVGMGGNTINISNNIELKIKFKKLLKDNLLYKKRLQKIIAHVKRLERELSSRQEKINQLTMMTTLTTLPSMSTISENTAHLGEITDAFVVETVKAKVVNTDSPTALSNNILFTEDDTCNDDTGNDATPTEIKYRPITETSISIDNLGLDF